MFIIVVPDLVCDNIVGCGPVVLAGVDAFIILIQLLASFIFFPRYLHVKLCQCAFVPSLP